MAIARSATKQNGRTFRSRSFRRFVENTCSSDDSPHYGPDEMRPYRDRQLVPLCQNLVQDFRARCMRRSVCSVWASVVCHVIELIISSRRAPTSAFKVRAILPITYLLRAENVKCFTTHRKILDGSAMGRSDASKRLATRSK